MASKKDYFYLLICLALFFSGSFAPASAQTTTLPLTGVWNGFLQQSNVVECSNLSDSELSLVLTVRDYRGSTLGSLPFSLAGRGTRHLILDSFGISNSYGLYQIEDSQPGRSGTATCFTAFYRRSAPNSAKTVEYAFALPALDPLHGVSQGIVNSMNPSAAARPVYNFLSIYNPGSYTFSGSVEVYGADGAYDARQSFAVAPLGPFERRDYPLGHTAGQVVGTYRIVPDDNSMPYGAFLVRYAPNESGGYDFAIPLLALPGTCDPGPVPASTMDPAVNWGEVANPTPRSVETRIQILSRDGVLLLDEVRTIAPFSQHHVHINARLGARNVGTFHAFCTRPSDPANKLLVESLYYGQLHPQSAHIEWAYASQAKGALINGTQSVAVPLNTFLGAANWTKLLDAAASVTQASWQAFDLEGETLRTGNVSIPARGSQDLGMHQFVGPDFGGLGLYYLSENALLYPEILRVFPHAQGSIGYIMNIPGVVSTLNPGLDPSPGQIIQRVVDSVSQANWQDTAARLTGVLPITVDNRQVFLSSRNSRTSGSNLAASYLKEQLQALGFPVTEQPVSCSGVVSKNLIASLPGDGRTTGHIVLGAHYDSQNDDDYYDSPGADDNASGVATVLEAARVLKGYNFSHPIDFVFFGAEEEGMCGSYAFVADAARRGIAITGAVLVDMVGYYDEHYEMTIEGLRVYAAWMSYAVQALELYTDLEWVETWHSSDSDHIPFQQSNIPAYLLIESDWSNDHYHTEADTYAVLRPVFGYNATRAAAAIVAATAGIMN